MPKTSKVPLTLCFSVCFLVGTQSQISCPVDWVVNEQSQSCIRIYSPEATWYEGRVACQAEGGDLVKIVNQQMQDFIYELFYSEDRGDLCCAWIGLHYLEEGDKWVWLDEESEAEWTSWYVNQPSADSDYPCVGTYLTSGGDWVNSNCYYDDLQTYICERYPMASTTAATTTEVTTTLEPSTVVTTEVTTTLEPSIVVTTEVTTTLEPSTVVTSDKTREVVNATETESTMSTKETSPKYLTASATATTTNTTEKRTSHATTANDFTAKTASSATPEFSTSVATGTTPYLSDSLYTYLLVAVVAVLCLILIVLTAIFLQRCHLRRRRTKDTTEPTIKYEREAEQIQFSNTIYDYPNGEQGTVF